MSLGACFATVFLVPQPFPRPGVREPPVVRLCSRLSLSSAKGMVSLWFRWTSPCFPIMCIPGGVVTAVPLPSMRDLAPWEMAAEMLEG